MSAGEDSGREDEVVEEVGREWLLQELQRMDDSQQLAGWGTWSPTSLA